MNSKRFAIPGDYEAENYPRFLGIFKIVLIMRFISCGVMCLAYRNGISLRLIIRERFDPVDISDQSTSGGNCFTN